LWDELAGQTPLQVSCGYHFLLASLPQSLAKRIPFSVSVHGISCLLLLQKLSSGQGWNIMHWMINVNLFPNLQYDLKTVISNLSNLP
jgi:hypothetical protein